MKIRDYFLTKEVFEISRSNYDGVLETKNIPENMDMYYKSSEYMPHSKNNSLKSKIYQFIQSLNEKHKLKIISKYKSSGKLLDYGCGDGAFLKFMKKHHFDVSGYEPNQKAREIAASKISEEKMFSSLDEIKDHSFDVVTLWHVLEHIPNPEEILSKIKQKLRDDGVLIIAVPNYQSYDAQFYKKHWAAWDVPRHIFHYSKEGAMCFFNRNKLNLLATYSLPFDSFYISLISENYTKNSLGILRAPFVASLSNLKGMKDGNFSSVIYILK